jgi:hypothetical protein
VCDCVYVHVFVRIIVYACVTQACLQAFKSRSLQDLIADENMSAFVSVQT